MPRQEATVVENQLNRGLITEATALSFPEHACTETFNCIFERTGKVTRRRGIDYISSTTSTQTRDDDYITEFVWDAVGGDGSVTLVVVQIGSTLHYYKVTANGDLAANKQAFTTDLTDFLPSGSARDPADAPCQFDAGKGYLFVTNPNINPFYVEYDSSGPSITETEITIEIRDMEGLDDGLEVDERPTVISDEHRYNLYNQGWGREAEEDGGTIVVAYDEWDTVRADYPSNADIFWIFRDGTSGRLDITDVGHHDLGNSPAPKGYYIFEAFNKDREALLEADTGLAHTITTVTAGNRRPACVAFFAGRAWFGGVDRQDYNDKIYFTQIIERDEQIGHCYQQNDPTSEEQSDLLPSDGGVISIPDLGTVHRLIPIQDQLLIFASNGVWAVQGSEGLGFRANDYAIQKISTTGARSGQSFVMVNGLPIWWNLNGIYTIGSGEGGGILGVESLTESTIQTFYDAIPTSSILKAKGAYNPRTKVVQWVYRLTHSDDVDVAQNCNRILNFNTETAAFYPWTVSVSSVNINGIVCIENQLSSSASATDFHYLTSKLSSGTDFLIGWAKETDEDYLDWTTPDTTGHDFDSYLITGYSVLGEGNKDFQSNYVTIYLENDEDTSLFAQGVWDFAKVDTTARWSNPQQCYKLIDQDDFSYVTKRLKIRGRGKALQLKFYSESGKPFALVGWSTWVTGNAAP